MGQTKRKPKIQPHCMGGDIGKRVAPTTVRHEIGLVFGHAADTIAISPNR